jgi:hypothetical protein
MSAADKDVPVFLRTSSAVPRTASHDLLSAVICNILSDYDTIDRFWNLSRSIFLRTMRRASLHPNCVSAREKSTYDNRHLHRLSDTSILPPTAESRDRLPAPSAHQPFTLLHLTFGKVVLARQVQVLNGRLPSASNKALCNFALSSGYRFPLHMHGVLPSGRVRFTALKKKLLQCIYLVQA